MFVQKAGRILGIMKHLANTVSLYERQRDTAGRNFMIKARYLMLRNRQSGYGAYMT